ncbi:MAG: hypothetical protein UHD09_06350 [Bifidobacterium sp.]|nr:hypothetical protein [Bifidobacterium sp.]
MMFFTMFRLHEGDFRYVLPFVIFYSFLKVGDYALGAIGTVTNPYRLAQWCLAIAAAGAFFEMFGFAWLGFEDIGAILMGASLSVFGPMYKTVKADLKKSGDYPYPHASQWGMLVMVALFFVIMLLPDHYSEGTYVAYFLLLIVSLTTIHALTRHEPGYRKPLFDTSTRDWRHIIPAVALLLLVFVVRLFRQTADAGDVMLMFIAATLVVVTALAKLGRRKAHFEFHSMYYSEVLIYVILFGVFIFIGEGRTELLLLMFAAMFAAQFLAQTFAGRLMARAPRLRVSNVIICALIVTSPLMLFRQTYFLGCFVTFALTTAGHIRVNQLYAQRQPHPRLGAQLSNQYMSDLGIIAGQTELVIALAVVSWAMAHSTTIAVAAYAFHIPRPSLERVFLVTAIVCTLIFDVQGALLLGAHLCGEEVFELPRDASDDVREATGEAAPEVPTHDATSMSATPSTAMPTSTGASPGAPSAGSAGDAA